MRLCSTATTQPSRRLLPKLSKFSSGITLPFLPPSLPPFFKKTGKPTDATRAAKTTTTTAAAVVILQREPMCLYGRFRAAEGGADSALLRRTEPNSQSRLSEQLAYISHPTPGRRAADATLLCRIFYSWFSLALFQTRLYVPHFSIDDDGGRRKLSASLEIPPRSIIVAFAENI